MIDKQVIVMRSDLKNYDGLKIRKEKPQLKFYKT